MWIIRITPYRFCNSIQETNNSVFGSRSCTHLLLQVNVYASKTQTKTLGNHKNRLPKSLVGVSTFARRKEEKNTHFRLCVEVMRKSLNLVCLYRIENLKQKLHQAMWDTLSQSTLTNPQGL